MTGSLCITSKGIKYALDKPMPGNSIVTMYVTFADDQSSIAFALLCWVSDSGKTFTAEIRDAAAITAATRTEVGTYTVPGGKGGTLKWILVNYHGTLETAVGQGGKVEFENDSVDWIPTHLTLDNRDVLVT